MKIVERSVGNFNQRRKEIIAKAKQEAQNKEKQINDLIQDLANINRQDEKLQEVQEEKAKEAENRFKFDESKDLGLSREKAEIDKKVEELQNKLRNLENSEEVNNPSLQREKEDLNKQLWDLKMDGLTKKPSVAPSDHDQRGNSPTDSNQNKFKTEKRTKENATPEEIGVAYEKLLQEYHPEKIKLKKLREPDEVELKKYQEVEKAYKKFAFEPAKYTCCGQKGYLKPCTNMFYPCL
ncbi:20287_t:CDS:2 [Funneliformis geosporum]|nr:20287_t:CDS:2 [Funneliformis geosporum]